MLNGLHVLSHIIPYKSEYYYSHLTDKETAIHRISFPQIDPSGAQLGFESGSMESHSFIQQIFIECSVDLKN